MLVYSTFLCEIIVRAPGRKRYKPTKLGGGGGAKQNRSLFSYEYMKSNQRLDGEKGLLWEGWKSSTLETGQPSLPNRVVGENVIQVKKVFGDAEVTYTLNSFCWNPISSVSKQAGLDL